eukprot:GHVS01085911.1.p1 GENE.GHVS01085911.1~~GHVS01085911.1.p1  ORF type:complete len:283 (-),score=12.04 GHVS01085911.1:684-1532(-)
MPLQVHRLYRNVFTVRGIPIVSWNRPVDLELPPSWPSAHHLRPCRQWLYSASWRSIASQDGSSNGAQHVGNSGEAQTEGCLSSELDRTKSSYHSGNFVRRRASVDIQAMGPIGSREVAIIDGATTMKSGPPDTFINPGYVVAPKGDGGMLDVVQTLKETLAVQLLALSKTSFEIAQSYIDLAMAEHTALHIQDAMRHYMEALKIYQAIMKRIEQDVACGGTTTEDAEQVALRRRRARINEAKSYTYLGWSKKPLRSLSRCCNCFVQVLSAETGVMFSRPSRT